MCSVCSVCPCVPRVPYVPCAYRRLSACLNTQIIIFMKSKDKAQNLILFFFALQKCHDNKRCTICESLLSDSISVSRCEKAPPPLILVNRTSPPYSQKPVNRPDCQLVTSTPPHTTRVFFKMCHLRRCLPMLSFLQHF